MNVNRELPPIGMPGSTYGGHHLARLLHRCGGCACQDVTTFQGSESRGQHFAAGQLQKKFRSVGASNRASEIQLHEALRLTHAFAGGKFNPLVRWKRPSWPKI